MRISDWSSDVCSSDLRYPGSGRLAGKVAIVTGGDSGIGRAICALFAREGADIAIVYLENKVDAADTVAIVEAEGRRVIAIKADVGRSEEHTSELQSLMRNSYAVFCLKKKNTTRRKTRLQKRLYHT